MLGQAPLSPQMLYRAAVQVSVSEAGGKGVLGPAALAHSQAGRQPGLTLVWPPLFLPARPGPVYSCLQRSLAFLILREPQSAQVPLDVQDRWRIVGARGCPQSSGPRSCLSKGRFIPKVKHLTFDMCRTWRSHGKSRWGQRGEFQANPGFIGCPDKNTNGVTLTARSQLFPPVQFPVGVVCVCFLSLFL